MPRGHVAIVSRDVADALLSGRKRVESRLFRARRPPYGAIRPGERIFFKRSGGAVFATARAIWVEFATFASPNAVAAAARRLGRLVAAPRAYWSARREARYGVFIGLSAVRPTRAGPRVPRQFGGGWVVLSDRWGPDEAPQNKRQ